MRGLPRSRPVRVLLASLAGWLVIACSAPQTTTPSPMPSSPTPSPSPSPTARVRVEPTITLSSRPNTNIQAGWTEYEELESGFALALPPHWRRVLPAGNTFTLSAGARKGRLLPLSSGTVILAEGASRVRFLAVETGANEGAGPLASVNVLERPFDQAMDLAAFVESNGRTLETSAEVSTDVEQARVALPAGSGVRLRYHLQAGSPAESALELALTQYLVVRSRRGYVLTGAAPPDAEGDYWPLFEGIAASLRWLS